MNREVLRVSFFMGTGTVKEFQNIEIEIPIPTNREKI